MRLLKHPEWTERTARILKRALDFEAQLLDISKVTGAEYDQVKEDVEKYARENPVTLGQAASVVAERLLRR